MSPPSLDPCAFCGAPNGGERCHTCGTLPSWQQWLAARFPSGLPLGELRTANMRRIPTFKDAHGRPAHPEPDGSDWSIADWFTATAGELGELGNLLKKVRRGDRTMDEAKPEIAAEIADVLIYLDILAFRLGVDLTAATVEKFNRVSARVGSPVRLGYTDWHLSRESPRVALPDNG